MARSNQSSWLFAALVIGGLYWVKTKVVSAATGTGMPVNPNPRGPIAPVGSPGSAAPTASQASITSAIWQNLTSTTGPSSGYVNFPSGAQAAAALLPWSTDGAGNYYTQWSGQIYYISGVPDASGNYPATLLGA